jgi:16S rRNA G527 N7-methylase RsmG
LGTGPGLPGIVLAIAAPGREILLVDSNGKKVRFLREAIRALKLDGVSAVQSRVEDVQGQYDCVTARAFASLADMLGWGGHLLAPDGIWLAMKGKRPDDELPGIPAGFELRGTHELAVPGPDPRLYSSSTPPLLSITCAYSFALAFGVRCWVAKSTWYRPKRLEKPSDHSRLSSSDHA